VKRETAHLRLTDDLRERAALHALGALPEADTRAFEAHLAAGCSTCTQEVDSMRATAGDLLLAAPPVAPAADLRRRVLAMATPNVVPRSPFHFVLHTEGTWVEIAPGISRKDLTAEVSAGSVTYLVRMQRGARLGTHHHGAVEHCYVVSGDLHVAGHHLHGGDYHRADQRSTHAETTTDDGCLLLIVESPA